VPLYDRATGVVRAIYDSRIATPATLEAEHYFPKAKHFSERWTDIRREALAVAGMLNQVPRFHDIMPAQADISANDGRDWRVFIMKAYGVTVQENLRRCPTVAALLDEAPEVPACEMNIDGVPYRLGDGESLLWDDTYPHEVWNRSDQVRIALLLDVWRRDMPFDIALLSQAILLATKTAIRMGGMSYGG
jgi:aspartate beta-hydroxylase